MKYLSTMILIAFVMLFTSEAKAQVPPKQPPRKKSAKVTQPKPKMDESSRKRCIRLLSAIEKVPKPTPEKCAKLQAVKEQAEPPRKKPVKTETCCDKCTRLLTKVTEVVISLADEAEAKAKEPPRDNAIGMGVITDGKSVGVILTSEFVLYRYYRLIGIGFSPKLSYMQGELSVTSDIANNDVTVSKFDVSADAFVMFNTWRDKIHLGVHVGLGLRYFHHGDTVLGVDPADDTWKGIEAGNDFHFLVSFAMVLDFAFTKSLRVSAFYRNTTAINQILYFSMDGNHKRINYIDHVGGLLFSLLIP